MLQETVRSNTCHILKGSTFVTLNVSCQRPEQHVFFMARARSRSVCLRKYTYKFAKEPIFIQNVDFKYHFVQWLEQSLNFTVLQGESSKEHQIQKQPPPATLLKKRLWHRSFPVNFVKFLRKRFLQNTSGRLLLQIAKIGPSNISININNF